MDDPSSAVRIEEPRPGFAKDHYVPVLMERPQTGMDRLLESPYRRYVDRAEFEAVLTDASLALVFVDDAEPGFRAWFRTLRLRHPATRFVCLAPLHGSVAREIVRAHPDDVVWWPDELGGGASTAVSDAWWNPAHAAVWSGCSKRPNPST